VHACALARAEGRARRAREHIEVVVRVEEDLLERGRLLLRRAQVLVQPEERPREREEHKADHHRERDEVTDRRVRVRVKQRGAEEIADALERVLPAREQRDELEQLGLLRVGRDELGDRLAAELCQVLCDAAQHLRERDEDNRGALLPVRLPAKKHAEPADLQREPHVECPPDAPAVAKHARRNVGHDARELVEREHDSNFLHAVSEGVAWREVGMPARARAFPPRTRARRRRGRRTMAVKP